MNILLLKGFNNYFNRTVKKYSTLADYKTNSTSFLEFTNINFNPNDGVATELIIGNSSQTEGDQVLFWEYNGTPDYLVCYDVGDNENLIRSRWFVLESARTRTGQYRVALKRDVIAENFNLIMNAPCFVEKGAITASDNPLLYNKESMTYNQIKQEEYLLKDSTNSAWIVGYYAKNYDPGAGGAAVSTEMSIVDGIPLDYYDEEDLPFSVSTTGGTTAYVYKPDSFDVMTPVAYFKNGGWGNFYINQGFNFHSYNSANPTTMALHNKIEDTNLAVSSSNIGNMTVSPAQVISNSNCATFNAAASAYYDLATGDGNIRVRVTPSIGNTNINIFGDKYFYTWSEPLDHDQDKQAPASTIEPLPYPSSTYSNAIKTLVNSSMQGISQITYLNGDILNYNGKYVKVGSSYYRMSIAAIGINRYDFFMSTSTAGTSPTITGLNDNTVVTHTSSSYNTALANFLTNIQNGSSGRILASTTNMPATAAVAVSAGYSVVLSKISVETLDTTLVRGKRVTYDCPANIFAIPYGNLKFKTSSDGDTYTIQPDESLALARAIAKQMGDSVCYDLQLLPYVPSAIVRDLMSNSDTLLLTDLEAANYITATRTSLGTTSTASFVLFPSSCKGTFDIEQVINYYNNPNYSKALNAKISNEVELCRLVSPNYNGMFEFSLAKNNGLSSVNVDYTYKPYQPYIHVNPDFKFIYGQDWNDSRGLICGGDFSLAFINDAWQAYQNNNKNYQAIFDRQIQNMDVNNAIAKEQLDYKGVMGIVGNALDAAFQGAAMNPRAIKTATFDQFDVTYGYVKDSEWLRRSQEEAKNYATDLYGYRLGNIQAMPYSLSRSEALTNNNKLWPIIEVYRCTDLEINNLVNKLGYNGMTIMAIGKLNDYKFSPDFYKLYLKGQLIRLENLSDDFHVADAIYQEVNKGFFIPQIEFTVIDDYVPINPHGPIGG